MLIKGKIRELDVEPVQPPVKMTVPENPVPHVIPAEQVEVHDPVPSEVPVHEQDLIPA